jgi:transcriptional regulator with XRE-family HTH domain
MLTTLGKELRKIRFDRKEVLYNMAQNLGISPSLLSAYEGGRRKVQDGFLDKVIRVYGLSKEEGDSLRKAEAETVNEATINLVSKSWQQRNVAILLARRFDSLSDSQLESLKKILKNNEE